MDSTQQQPETGEVKLTEYQREWLRDKAQFKLAVKSRQIGFTFATTLEIALECIDRPTRWRIISRTQDTAKEAIREVKKHLQAMHAAIKGDDIEERQTDLFWEGVRIAAFVITLPNGSEIQALTAHPDAGRGFPGSFFLDEFAMHRESYELWKGAFPNTQWGHRLIVCSTPRYQQGKYFELARACDMSGGRTFEGARQKGIWSRHWVDVHMAIPQLRGIGVPASIETMREGAGDEETWAQEFCCQFLSAAEMWIALDLIAGARSPLAFTTWDPAYAFQGPLYIGIDVARKRDLTAVWIDERQGQAAYLRGLVTMRNTSTVDQFDQIAKIVEHANVKRVCIDAGGVGTGLFDLLYKRFGGKVEGVTFTNEIKERMAVMVRRRMEEKLDKIPENAPSIERAFAAIKRETTYSGNLRFDAARSDAGHADEFWAKALADLAADSGVAAACVALDPEEEAARERETPRRQTIYERDEYEESYRSSIFA